MKTTNIYLSVMISILLLSCQTPDEQIQKWVEKNPDKIFKSLFEFQRSQQEKERPSSKDVIANASELFDNPGSPKTGSGSIKIAYFFDFNCPHCARQSEIIKQLLAKNSNVQIIYKNFGILSPSSALTAKAALAAHLQGKYQEFYNEAFKIRDKTDESLKVIAKKINLNIPKWEADMKSEEVKKEISHVHKLAEKLKLSGAPAIAITPDIIFTGRVDQLIEVVDSMKK